jgi:hypothetical protein
MLLRVSKYERRLQEDAKLRGIYHDSRLLLEYMRSPHIYNKMVSGKQSVIVITSQAENYTQFERT